MIVIAILQEETVEEEEDEDEDEEEEEEAGAVSSDAEIGPLSCVMLCMCAKDCPLHACVLLYTGTPTVVQCPVQAFRTGLSLLLGQISSSPLGACKDCLLLSS